MTRLPSAPDLLSTVRTFDLAPTCGSFWSSSLARDERSEAMNCRRHGWLERQHEWVSYQKQYRIGQTRLPCLKTPLPYRRPIPAQWLRPLRTQFMSRPPTRSSISAPAPESVSERNSVPPNATCLRQRLWALSWRSRLCSSG